MTRRHPESVANTRARRKLADTEARRPLANTESRRRLSALPPCKACGEYELYVTHTERHPSGLVVRSCKCRACGKTQPVKRREK